MSRTIINITMILVMFFFADKAYNTFMPAPDSRILKIEKVKGDSATKQAAKIAPLTNSSKPVLNYSVIHENDLFRMQREEYVPPDAPVIEPIIEEPEIIVIARPSLILHGVMKLGDTSFALIEDIKAPPELAGSKSYKVGDTLHGFDIVKILQDKVVISNDETSYDVLLYERKKSAVGARKPVIRTPRKVVRQVKEKKSKEEQEKAILDEEQKKQKRFNAIKNIFGTTKK